MGEERLYVCRIVGFMVVVVGSGSFRGRVVFIGDC